MTYSPTSSELNTLESEGGLIGELLDRLEDADAEIECLRAAIARHRGVQLPYMDPSESDKELWAVLETKP